MFKKRNKKTVKKIGAIFSVFCMFFLEFSPLITHAEIIEVTPAGDYDITIPDTPTAVNSTESIGVVAEGVKSKESGPNVSVSFTSDNNFKNGSKVTATAVPGGFLDDTKDLYFTWYIKHKNCDLKENVGDNNNCDLDNDNDITENDWKIAATKAILQNNTRVDTSDGTKANPSIKDWDGDEIDENDAEAEDDVIENCYIQPSESGTIYELRETGVSFNILEGDLACPLGYQPACLEDKQVSCEVLNPEYAEELTETECVIPIGGTIASKTITDEFNACVINTQNSDAESIFNCSIKDADRPGNFESIVECKNNDELVPICVRDSNNNNIEIEDLSINTVTEITPITRANPPSPYPTPSTLPGKTDLLGIIFSENEDENELNSEICSALANENTYDEDDCNGTLMPDPITGIPAYFNSSYPKMPLIEEHAITQSCSSFRDVLADGLSYTSESGGTNTIIELFRGNSELNPTCVFQKGENLCKHLFPEYKEDSLKNEAVGDDSFSSEEKNFWGTENPDLINGAKGEASIMGQGVDTITWTFIEGDEIGVAVEGKTDLLTEHVDSSYRRMWAFSKGACEALNDDDEVTRGYYIEKHDNGDVGILTAQFKDTEEGLNICLEENLLKPNNNGLSDMKVILEALPNNPTNNPNGVGDQVSVIASVQNSSDLENIEYKWEVDKIKDSSLAPSDDTEWVNIIKYMVENGSLASTDWQGLGKNNLKFLLNLPTGIVDPKTTGEFYLRIRVTAKERSGSGSQTSRGEIIIKVRQQEDYIDAYSVIANSEGKLTLDEDNGVCTSTEETKRCKVTKNQIVGIKILNSEDNLSGFSWKVNNTPMTCTSDISEACNGSNNIFFFPVLGEEDEAIDVVATALSSKTGGTIEISRHFVIVKPQVQIESINNNVWPKLLGFYKDLDGNKIKDDYSSEVFETYSGNTANLRAMVYSASNQGKNFVWEVDGESYENSFENGENMDRITFPVDKAAEDNYNVGVTLSIQRGTEQDRLVNNLRKALQKNWGIDAEMYAPFGDSESISSNIQINVLENPSLTTFNLKRDGIFASVIKSLPEQAFFLLETVLATFGIIFLMGLMFAFIPESIFEKEKNDAIQNFRF